MNHEKFIAIGQKRLLEQSFLSDFAIWSLDGQSAPENVSREVHDFLTKILIVHHTFQPMIPFMQKSLENQQQIDFSTLKLAGNPDDLCMDSLPRIIQKMKEMIDFVKSIQTKELWDEGDMAELNTLWSDVWNMYQKRATVLILSYQGLRALRTQDEHEAHYLSKETDALHELVIMLAGKHHAVREYTIDELIQFHYESSHRAPEDQPIEKKHRLYRVSNGVVVFIQRLFLWFLIPLIIIGLVSEGELTIGTLFPLISFAFISIYVRNLNRVHLYGRIHQQLEELKISKIASKHFKTS